MTAFEDITYDVDGSAAIMAINRPDRYNAFRARTVDELIVATEMAWSDRQARCVILTGAGDEAFCTGGDVKQRAETGDYGPSETADSASATCTSSFETFPSRSSPPSTGLP